MSRTVPLLLPISPVDPRPIVRQITDGIRLAIASGELPAGAQLPSVRGLAQQLAINPKTVAKAYAELESQGVIESLPGKGCFLKSGPSLLKKEARQQLLNEELDALIVQAHHLQIESAELITLLQRRLEAFAVKLRNHTNAQQP